MGFEDYICALKDLLRDYAVLASMFSFFFVIFISIQTITALAKKFCKQPKYETFFKF